MTSPTQKLDRQTSPWEWRKFRWKSSRTLSVQELTPLQESLIAYYSRDQSRDAYQAMLDQAQSSQPEVLGALVDSIVRHQPKQVLELGCGRGWILGHLISAGLEPSQYIGAELSSSVIDENRRQHPDSQWIHLTTYETEIPDRSVDVAFSYFVIEHCVFPERHLAELYRVVRPGGSVFIVCPNFVRGGILPSQFLGCAGENPKALLKQGRFWAALVGLFDSRIRLKLALRGLHKRHGTFVLNLTPRCILQPQIYAPDVDAVYISCDADFRTWAQEQNALFNLPRGTEGPFSAILFLQLSKPVT